MQRGALQRSVDRGPKAGEKADRDITARLPAIEVTGEAIHPDGHAARHPAYAFRPEALADAARESEPLAQDRQRPPPGGQANAGSDHLGKSIFTCAFLVFPLRGFFGDPCFVSRKSYT